MIDITSKIVEAMSLASHWAPEMVWHALSVLAERFLESEVDWEEGDEEWGRVTSRGEDMAYVSAICPFAFVKSDDEKASQEISARLGLVVVSVQDFYTTPVIVDPLVLSRLTRRPLTDNVSYNNASVNEIWFATI